MSASESLTAAPPWAVTAWVDDVNVYIELPTVNGAPFVTKFALTEGGLSKALHYMRAEHNKHQPQGGYYIVPDHTLKPSKGIEKVKASERTRESTRAILKRLGLT